MNAEDLGPSTNDVLNGEYQKGEISQPTHSCGVWLIVLMRE